MAVDALLQKLKGKIDAMAGDGDMLKTIAAEIADYFSIRIHEVGIFAVKKHEIVFLWPLGMANAGHIPLKAVNSLVAKTANGLMTTLDNSFASSRHLFIFEFMLAEKSDRIPIQKIMSAPIAADGAAKGVIQIVRKGASAAEAGEDFSEQNLADLVKIADLLAKYTLPGA